jgi:hypothetical protein
MTSISISNDNGQNHTFVRLGFAGFLGQIKGHQSNTGDKRVSNVS